MAAPPPPRPPESRVAAQRTCPTCKGTGINPAWPSHVCPRCNGERVVPVRLR